MSTALTVHVGKEQNHQDILSVAALLLPVGPVGERSLEVAAAQSKMGKANPLSALISPPYRASRNNQNPAEKELRIIQERIDAAQTEIDIVESEIQRLKSHLAQAEKGPRRGRRISERRMRMIQALTRDYDDRSGWIIRDRDGHEWDDYIRRSIDDDWLGFDDGYDDSPEDIRGEIVDRQAFLVDLRQEYDALVARRQEVLSRNVILVDSRRFTVDAASGTWIGLAAHIRSGDTIQRSDSLLIRLRPGAARYAARLAIEPFSTLSGVICQGSFDLMTVNDAIRHGVVLPPHFPPGSRRLFELATLREEILPAPDNLIPTIALRARPQKRTFTIADAPVTAPSPMVQPRTLSFD